MRRSAAMKAPSFTRIAKTRKPRDCPFICRATRKFTAIPSPHTASHFCPSNSPTDGWQQLTRCFHNKKGCSGARLSGGPRNTLNSFSIQRSRTLKNPVHIALIRPVIEIINLRKAGKPPQAIGVIDINISLYGICGRIDGA